MKWFCRYCFHDPPIEFHKSPTDNRDRYVCKRCGVYGNMSDADAPIQITDEVWDKWWHELQEDPTFQIPENPVNSEIVDDDVYSTEYIRCCDVTKTNNAIRLEDDNRFYLEILIPDAIEYCPWCGVLLDTNLIGE